MEFLKTKTCARQLIKSGLSDKELSKAISEFIEGLHDGQLGNSLFKKRVPRMGKGKRGGARTILFYKKNKRLIFLHVFAKNEKANITKSERDVLNRLAATFDAYSNSEILNLINKKVLIEITYGGRS